MCNKKNIAYPDMILSFILFLCIALALPLNASIGSNTAVSRQSTYALFPYSSIPTNQLLGFTAAQQGIVIGRSDTTTSFSDFFPVSTLMDLRSGTVYLNYDLTLDQTVNFISTGSFVASGASAIFLPPLTTTLGFPTAINLLSFITAQTQTTAPTTADWAFDGLHTINSNGTAFVIHTFNGSTLASPTGANPGFTLNVLRWHPSQYYFLVGVTNGGSAFAIPYSYDPGSNTANQLTVVQIGPGGALTAMAFSPNGNFEANSGGANVYVGGFNAGTVTPNIASSGTLNTISPQALQWIDNAHFIAGLTGAPQLEVFNFNGTNTVTLVATSTLGNTVTAVAPAHFNGYVGVGLTGSTTNIRVYQYNGTNAITQVASIAESVAVNSMDWSTTGSFLSVGLATSNTESQIRVYYFNPTTLTLTLTGQVSSPSPTINEIRSNPINNYILTADSNASGTAAYLRALSVYQLLNQTTPFVFANTKLVMNSDVIMEAPITFQGLCEIEGNNNILDVSQITNFSIATNSTLLLKNMMIQGINRNNINFVDSTGVLQLQNLTWAQTNTFNFTQGALQIQNSVLITGSATPFIYQSAQPLTINTNSTLMFDQNMTFSYAPSSNANNVISMTDSTSILYFLSNQLFASAAGMKLTKGTLVIDGPCSVFSSAANASQGISFGDGVSAANNCTVKIFPESGFILNSGFLVYNNI
jgi:hypothetical protein